MLETVDQICRHVVAVILNGTIQGILLFGFIYIILSLWKNIDARTRHFIWFITIASFAVLPVFTIFFEAVNIDLFGAREKSAAIYETFSSVIPVNSISGTAATANTTLTNLTDYRIDVSTTNLRWIVLFIGWITVAFFTFFRFVLGIIKAGEIKRTGTLVKDAAMLNHFQKLCGRNNVRKNIRLYISTEAESPYTFGFLRPSIVLPVTINQWNKKDLKPVLIHELEHIKRKDFLSQSIASFICSIFWFVPMVWILRQNLYVEQEKACDDGVIQNGENRKHYAKQMIRLASSTGKKNLSPALYIFNGRKKTFEKRIKYILENRREKMKKMNLWIIGIAFACIFTFIGACSTENKSMTRTNTYELQADEPLLGEWVNPDYEEVSDKIAVMAFYENGVALEYLRKTNAHPKSVFSYEIINKEVDEQGDIWYLLRIEEIHKWAGYPLIHIFDSGTAMEFDISAKKPEEFYPINQVSYRGVYKK